jgi:hypothetical protein
VLIPQFKMAINKCYSVGSVTGSTAGGLIGDSLGSVFNCFYDSQTSGQSDNTGKGVPKTTSGMMNINTFIIVGWDIIEKKDYDGEIWFIDSNTPMEEI